MHRRVEVPYLWIGEEANIELILQPSPSDQQWEASTNQEPLYSTSCRLAPIIWDEIAMAHNVLKDRIFLCCARSHGIAMVLRIHIAQSRKPSLWSGEGIRKEIPTNMYRVEYGSLYSKEYIAMPTDDSAAHYSHLPLSHLKPLMSFI